MRHYNSKTGSELIVERRKSEVLAPRTRTTEQVAKDAYDAGAAFAKELAERTEKPSQNDK